MGQTFQVETQVKGAKGKVKFIGKSSRIGNKRGRKGVAGQCLKWKVKSNVSSGKSSQGGQVKSQVGLIEN